MNDLHVSFREKCGYGLGDAASNIFWKLFSMYLLFFYTDIFGLPAAAVGTMFLVTRIWDALIDPVVGRPYADPLGQVPPLSPLVPRSVRCAGGADLYHARFRPDRQTGVRLHYLQFDDDGLFAGQCALCLAARSHLS